MRHARITVAAIAIAIGVIATAGGITFASTASSSIRNHSPAATRPITGPPADVRGSSNLATVHAVTASVQGITEPILVDAKGLPLYIYKPDTSTTSNVTGQLAALWPPLVAAAPIRGSTGGLTSVETANGDQVAYNGHFLYTFVEDSPGRVTGQGVQSFFVATPGLSAAAAPSATAPPAPASNGYGY